MPENLVTTRMYSSALTPGPQLSPSSPKLQGVLGGTSGSAAYVLDEGSKLVVHPERGMFRVPPAEFNLLVFLHRHKGQLFPCDELLLRVWADEYRVLEPDLVRVTVYHLRKRVAPDIVDCVRCFGYGVGIAAPTMGIGQR